MAGALAAAAERGDVERVRELARLLAAEPGQAAESVAAVVGWAYAAIEQARRSEAFLRRLLPALRAAGARADVKARLCIDAAIIAELGDALDAPDARPLWRAWDRYFGRWTRKQAGPLPANTFGLLPAVDFTHQAYRHTLTVVLAWLKDRDNERKCTTAAVSIAAARARKPEATEQERGAAHELFDAATAELNGGGRQRAAASARAKLSATAAKLETGGNWHRDSAGPKALAMAIIERLGGASRETYRDLSRKTKRKRKRKV